MRLQGIQKTSIDLTNFQTELQKMAVVEGWFRWLEMERSQDTLESYQYGFEQFQKWLDRNHLDALEITSQHIAGWLIEIAEGRSRSTIELWFYSLRSFYKFCWQRDIIKNDPTAKIEIPRKLGKPPNPRTKLIGNESIRALLGSCPPNTFTGKRDRAILSLMAYCALRQIEVIRTQLEDLTNLNGRLVLYIQRKARTSKNEHVVIPVREEIIFENYIAVRGKQPGPLFIKRPIHLLRAFTRDDLYSMVKDRMLSVGIEAPPHSLRKTAAMNLYKRKVPIELAQILLGHRSIQTTLDHYLEFDRISHPVEDLIDYEGE